MQVSAVTRVIHNKVSNVSAGTAVRFVSQPTPIRSLLVYANDANTGKVYIGGSGVNSTNTPPLSAGDQLPFEFVEFEGDIADNLADFYIDAAVSGEGITYIAVKQ